MYFASNTNINNVLSDFDMDCQFCEACIDNYAQTNNEEFLGACLNEDLFHKTKRLIRQNKGKVAIGASILGTIGNGYYTATKLIKDADDENKDGLDLLGDLGAGGARQIGLLGVGAYGVGTGTKHYIDKFRNRPKSVIAKKIAALRKVYSKWLQKANNAIEDREANIAQKVCAKIMNIIDGLLELLQRKADGK